MENTPKDDTVLKTYRMDAKTGGYINCCRPWESNRPSSLVTYSTATNTLNYFLNESKRSKSLLQLVNINASNLLSGKRHLSGLSIRPATLKIHLLVISKLLTITSNCGFRSSASQHSIVQYFI